MEKEVIYCGIPDEWPAGNGKTAASVLGVFQTPREKRLTTSPASAQESIQRI